MSRAIQKLSFLFFCIQALFSSAQAPANFNFELSTPGTYTTANAVAGWTVESASNSMSFGGIECSASNTSIAWATGSPEFSILATPMVSLPYIGTLPNSPFGGNHVARLNNIITTNPPTALATRIKTQLSVSASSNLFKLAFAGSFDGAHPCCESAALIVNFYNCAATPSLIANLSRTLTPGSGLCLGVFGYSLTGSVSWTNWQISLFDLSPYTGQCLQLVITASDCAYAGGHHGSAFIDLDLTNSFVSLYSPNIVATGSGSAVSFCPGSNTALLQGPLGYTSYQWIAPGNIVVPAPLGNSPNFITNGAIPFSVWTLQVTLNGITTPITYTIFPSQVNIAGIGSSSSCIGGNNGGATVVANGSGTGYNYIWLNSGSVTVGTSSAVSNLAPGIYTVIVASNSGSTCGTANTTVSIGTQTNNSIQTIFKPFCGNEAYFCAGAGSNYQWYNGTVAIAPPLGTTQCYTLTNPTNGGFVHLKYLSAQGCQDSLKFILGTSSLGSLGISSSNYACQGSSNGSIVISMSPAIWAPPGQSSFSVFSTGSLNPNYTASLAAGFQNSLGLTNLSAGNYSIVAFDGSCKYTNSFVIVNFPNTFTLSANSTTLCSGQMAAAGVTFTSLPGPGQYTYSWSPSNLLAGSNQQSTIILQNTPAPGSLNTVVFTVVVTPSLINCPMSKTMAITWANPISPSIVAIPNLCSNAPNYTINVTPSGGSFMYMNSPGIDPLTGVLTPSLANVGVNSFVYNNSVGPCIANASATYNIEGPSLSFSGNTLVCSGQSGLLYANGANSYTWNNGSNSNSISISPTINTVYSVTGSHTLDLCTSTRTVLVQSINPPSILISGNTTLCNPTTGTLFAAGANTYTWSNSTSGSSVAVAPLINTVYTVSGSNVLPNCIGHQTVLVIANIGPGVQISGDTMVCIGAQVVIIASGANSYTWSASPSTWTNSTNSSTLVIIQAASNIYTLTASSFSNPCISTRTLMVSVFPCTALGEIDSNDYPFKIYPNPSNGIFTIESAEQTEINVYNALGQLVLHKMILAGKQNIDLSGQVSGVYFIKTNSNEKPEVFRLIKEN